MRRASHLGFCCWRFVTSPLGLLWSVALLLPSITVIAMPVNRSADAPGAGHPDQGRELFNGKAICYYCHGQDGDPEVLPPLNEETMNLVRGLRPRPPDLRQPAKLRLRTDKERFQIIQDGHEGTGMLPDTSLSNQEIRDIVAYLAVLRGRDGHQ